MSLNEAQQVNADFLEAAEWQSHHPIHLPPSVIPGGSIAAALTSSSQSLFPRHGHALSNPTAQGGVYIFGGYVSLGSFKGSYLSDLWLYSLKDNTATLFQCYGDVPSPRIASSISITCDVLALWGGSSSEKRDDDVLYWLDLSMHIFSDAFSGFMFLCFRFS
jgi:hypothetical protein